MGPSVPAKRGTPQFSAHVCCGQTARWIKIPLDAEVGLGPDHTVLDGDPARHLKRGTASSLEKGHSRPQFSAHVYCGETAGWIKMPFGTKVVLGLGYIVLNGDPAPAPRKTGSQPPNFRPMSIVARWSPISATAEHLLSVEQKLPSFADETSTVLPRSP